MASGSLVSTKKSMQVLFGTAINRRHYSKAKKKIVDRGPGGIRQQDRIVKEASDTFIHLEAVSMLRSMQLRPAMLDWIIRRKKRRTQDG